MKRSASILCLILVLALFAFMALGSGSDSSKTDDVKTPSSVSTGGQVSEAKPASSSGETQSDPKASAAPAVTIQEAVLLEQNGLRITAKSFEADGMFGPSVKMLFENESQSSVTIQARMVSVNGYMVEPMMSVELAPGKKANDSLTLMSSDLKTAGITTIADIEFSFHVFDSASWDTLFDSAPVRIETSAAPTYAYTFDDSGSPAYSGNGVEIVVKGLSQSDSWLGPSVVVYISNTGSVPVTVQARDVSVNGFMVDAIFSSDVAAGKHAVDTITFMDSDLQNNGIETIEDIELSFHVFNESTWDTIVDTSPVTIDFK